MRNLSVGVGPARLVVAVGVDGLPVDSDVQATILPPPETGVQEWEHSILLYLNSELNGRLHTVEVI